MSLVIINDINVNLNTAALAKKLRIPKEGSSLFDRFQLLVDEGARIARPKGAYRPVDFNIQGDDGVIIDGIHLKSRVLSVHLAEIHRVFPFVATCGREVADWAAQQSELLERFWLETILDEILLCAITSTGKLMAETHALGKTAVMTPGSIDDWPLQEQRPLFTILGDIETAIGVRLRESFMMEPLQSVSGILFPTQIDFQTCMLCPRKACPKRRAPYDPDLYELEFRKK